MISLRRIFENFRSFSFPKKVGMRKRFFPAQPMQPGPIRQGLSKIKNMNAKFNSLRRQNNYDNNI